MVPLPPRYRTFVVPNKGLESKPIPAPEGVSLVTSHIYTRATMFYENVHHDPGFMNPMKFRENLSKVLDYYYPFSGRLIKRPNGRYDIGHFEKGALFEVVDSCDSFEDWKATNFSYSSVPYEEFFAISKYVGRDSPLLSIRMTFTRDKSCVLGFSFHHKVIDGRGITEFLENFTRVCYGKSLDPNKHYIYTDTMRAPVKPLPGVDHTNIYPLGPPHGPPLPPATLKSGPSKLVIFCFDKTSIQKLKSSVIADNQDPQLKLSMMEVLSAFVHKAIVKSRQTNDDYCSDLLYVISQNHRHPDKNMMQYFGNFFVTVPIQYTAKQVREKTLYEIAKDIHQTTQKIDVAYIESLEHYINHSNQVENLVSPYERLFFGAAGISDWTRFGISCDFGYGPRLRLRSFVETGTAPLTTVMPCYDNTTEVIIQLDTESLDRLLQDHEFMQFVKSVH